MRIRGTLGNAVSGQIQLEYLVGLALVVIIIITTFATVTVPWEYTETEYSSQPFAYEKEQIRSIQTRPFPWINEITQVQFTVTNNDTETGTFSLNFVFDNGKAIGNKKQTIHIMQGQSMTVIQNSPLSGISKVELEVTPPYKRIPNEVTKTKNVHIWVWAWNVFWRLLP